MTDSQPRPGDFTGQTALRQRLEADEQARQAKLQADRAIAVAASEAPKEGLAPVPRTEAEVAAYVDHEIARVDSYE